MPHLSQRDFATLVLSYLAELTAYARSLSRNDWDADDLIQSTYERAFGSRRHLREPGRCRAWLFRIARNLHVDQVRASAARPEIHLVESDRPAPDEARVSALWP